MQSDALSSAFVEVETLIRQGDFEQASQQLDAIAAQTPTGGDEGLYFYFRAEISRLTGDAEDAESGYQAAAAHLTDDSYLSEALFRLAEYHAMRGEADEAVALMNRSIALTPELSGKHIQAGYIYQRLGEWDKAESAFKKGLETAADPAEQAPAYLALTEVYRQTGDKERYFQAARNFVRSTRGDPNRLSENQRGMRSFFQGEILAAQGDDERAYRAYQRAAQFPLDTFRMAEVLMNLAEYEFSWGNVEKAREQAEKSAELLPDEPWKMQQVGYFLARLDMPEQAEVYFSRYLAIDPEPEKVAQIDAVLADAYKRADNQDKYRLFALRYIDTVSAADYVMSDDDRWRRTIYMRDIYGEPESSADASASTAETDSMADDWGDSLEDSVNQVASNALLQVFNEIRESIQHEEYNRARALLDQVESLDFDDNQRGMLLSYCGDLNWGLGNIDEAYADYAAAARLVTENFRLSEILFRIAEYHLRSGDPDQAYRVAGQSLELLPEQGWKHLQIGNFYLQLDRRAEAIAEFGRAADLAVTPSERGAAISAIAETYRLADDHDTFLRYAEDYISATDGLGEQLSDQERGLRAFYQAELYYSDGDMEKAYQSYEVAARYVTDRFRLAEIFMKLAEREALRNRYAEAAGYAEQSADLLPDQEWKLRQVGDFFLSISMPERAIVYYRKQIDAAATPREKASGYGALAELYKQQRNQTEYLRFARAYSAELAGADFALTPAEQGMLAYYQAEIVASEDSVDAAYAYYKIASDSITDPSRLSEIYIKLAEREAARGRIEVAVEYATKSADLLADQEWKLEQVGGFFLRLGLPERALGFYQKQLAHASTAKGRAAALRSLAEVSKQLQRQEQFLQYARAYVDETTNADFVLTPVEQGTVAYYRAELAAAEGDTVAAINWYIQAAQRAPDSARLSDIYQALAELEAGRGNTDQAAEYAIRSATVLPDQLWKLRQVGDFLIRMEMPGRALEFYHRWLELASAPEIKAAASSALAETYRQLQQYDQYHTYARLYIETVEAGERVLSDEEKGRVAFYQGELYLAADEAELANAAFEQAARWVDDDFRLSEIYMKLAAYQVEHGIREKAVGFIERSVALLPDQAWRLMEAGDLYSRMEMMDKAVVYYQQVVRYADTLGSRASAYVALAEAYLKMENREKYYYFAQEYVNAIQTNTDAVSAGEAGLADYYQAELFARDGDDRHAEQNYLRAFELLTDKFRLSDIAVKIANYRATAEKIAEAREWAARAGGLLPDQSWKQKQVGDFFLNLGDTHTAILYYDRAIAVADNAETRAAALIALAEAYRKLGDSETFINYAEQYIAIVTTRDVETPQESGLAWYYQGEIFTIRQKPDEAYRAYETASTLLTDKFRLSETFLKMAQYNAENSRNEGLAVEQALMSANLLPDQAWRVRDAAQILIHIGCVDDAARIMEEAIALNPVENGELFQDIANAYNQALRRNSALANNSRYIDFLYQKMDRLGAAVTEQQWVQLWNARQQQSNMSRTWGLDSYLFSNKQQGGDYYVGMLHELFYNYRIKNGMFGKIYGKYGGTLAARYSGTYYSPFFDEMQQWQSRQHLNESQYAILGIRINPINIAPALSFSLEGHIGIGDDTENDVVGRIIYDASAGLDLKPSGNHWAYWKIYSDTAYSTRNEDITSSGYLRGGVTVRGNFDRTLLFAPYGTMLYSYGGKDVSKGTRWGADAGMGLMIRKWFRQDRYHTPRSYVEANIFVIWGLSKDRNRAFGIDLSTSF